MTPEEMNEAHGLLHELWTETKKNDPGKKRKRKWCRLQDIIDRAFFELLGEPEGGWLEEVKRKMSGKTQVRFEELEPPPPSEWAKTYHMLTRDKPGSYDLISLHGFFPVFETREDAVMVVGALEESLPESGVKVRGLAYRIAAAAELSFGKPAKLVKPRIVSKDPK